MRSIKLMSKMEPIVNPRTGPSSGNELEEDVPWRRPQNGRRDVRERRTADIERRRAIIGVSLAGMAAMTPVSLLQTGIVRHLPGPPVRGFDSDKVNLSDAAYRFGAPDGPIALMSFAANIPLAFFGPADRAQTQPWAPGAAAAKGAIEALGRLQPDGCNTPSQ